MQYWNDSCFSYLILKKVLILIIQSEMVFTFPSVRLSEIRQKKKMWIIYQLTYIWID